MKKKYTLKIFCDFDGTVTKKDVWVDALGKFIKDDDAFSLVCRDFAEGRITSRECIRRELDLVEDFDLGIFNEYIDKQELDDHFVDFVDYCKENNFEITLVSEGLDYYIKYVLNKFKIDLPFYSNELVLKNDDGNRIKLTCNFPHSDENCAACGMSKRNVLISGTNELDRQVSVFIGDGVSDFCVSNYADIVFAKKGLASYCWKNNITYYDYNDFADVKKKLARLVEKGQIKHKQNAKNLRKDVLLGG